MRLVASLVCVLVVSSIPPVAAQHHHQHHPPAQGREVKVDFADDRDSSILTLRVGPFTVPPRMDHVSAPIATIRVPFDAWYVGYEPRVVDEGGRGSRTQVLHHVELLNIDRRNFICPRQPERMFAAGSELSHWPRVPGVGYRVARDQRIAVAVMLHNHSDHEASNSYLEIRIHYALPGATRLANVYPAWFVVSHCGPTIYDLPPGPHVKASEMVVPYPGALVGVGGHIHDYGRELRLDNATRDEHIATLKIDVDADGRLRPFPSSSFREDIDFVPATRSRSRRYTTIRLDVCCPTLLWASSSDTSFRIATRT